MHFWCFSRQCVRKTDIYKCAEKTLMDNKCAIHQTENDRMVHHLANCPSDETCTTTGDYSYCIKHTSRFKRWEGEKCSYNAECYTDICGTEEKCGVIANGQSCKDNQRGCSNKSFCNSENLCQALIAEGQTCKADATCDFPMLCGKKQLKMS